MPPYSYQWAAGIFEGEGCFSTHYGNKRKNGERFGPYPRACVHMVDKDVMENFASVMGGHIIEAKGTNKPRFVWQVSGQDAVGLVAHKIGPFLGERRLAKLREVLTEREP